MSRDTNLKCDWMAGTFTALITPFMLDGFAIDEDRFAEQIAFQAEPGDGASGVNGILVLGTTGESPTVTRAEGQRLAELAVEHGRARGLRVILGTGANNTAHAVELQRWAADAGADGTLSVVPYYNKPPQEGLYRHFQEVADAADLPVMLYNIPGRCGTGLALGTIERLAEHPNVVAVKHATGSVAEAAALRERCPRLAALSGDDPLTLDLAKVGVQGTVSVISNLVPGRVRQLMDAANAGDWQTAERLNEELLPLATGIMTLSTNPIGVKTALELLGRDSGALRLPLVAASEQARQTCRMLLEATDLLSLESAPRLSEASAVRMN